MTINERKILSDRIHGEYRLTNIFGRPTSKVSQKNEESIQGEMNTEQNIGENTYHNENVEENQCPAEFDINKVHGSRRPLLVKLVDKDTVNHYNGKEGDLGVQVPEKPKVKVKGKKMDRKEFFKTEWFQKIYVSLRDAKVGHTTQLKEEVLCKHLDLESIPGGIETSEVLEVVRYHLREYRKTMMPEVTSDKELAKLQLLSFKPALEKLINQQALNQTVSSLRTIYLSFLKDHLGSDPTSGVRNLSDPWSIKAIYLSPLMMSYFGDWLRAKETGYHASNISRIRGLSYLIFNQTSNPIRTRAGKHSTFSPEVEDFLQKFLRLGYEGGSGKNIVCHVREVIKLAGISNVATLKQVDVFDKVVQLNRSGFISDSHISRTKPFFRWLATDEMGIDVPGFFQNKNIEAVHNVTPEQQVWFDLHIRKLLVANGYKETSTKRPLDLYRYLLASLAKRGEKAFASIRPSDFILALGIADQKKASFGFLRGIKPLQDSLLDYSNAKNKWTLIDDESWDDFLSRCENSIDNAEMTQIQNIDLLKYKRCFVPEDRTWRSFFEVLTKDYYVVSGESEDQRKGGRGLTKEFIKASYYDQVWDFLLEAGHGSKCGNRKAGASRDVVGDYRAGGIMQKPIAEFTPDDKRELEHLTAFAFQATLAARFRSECREIVFFDKEPVLNDKTPPCIFSRKYVDSQLGENSALVVYIPGRVRKNKIAYFVPLSSMCDEFIYKHLAVQGIKEGERLFTMTTGMLANTIKKISSRIFKSHVSIAEIKSGEKANVNMTTHRFRNILVQIIEANYKGADSKDAQAIILGHKLKSLDGAATTAVYTEYLAACERLLPIIRRIKDRNYKTDADLQFDKVREELAEARQAIQNQLGEGFEEMKDEFQDLKARQFNAAAFLNQMAEDDPKKLMALFQATLPKLIKG